MSQFRTDNTEGYSADDIQELNARFDLRARSMLLMGIDIHDEDAKSLRDNLSEKVLAEFDADRHPWDRT